MILANEPLKLSSWLTTLLLALVMAVLVAVAGLAWWLWAGQPVDSAWLSDLSFKALFAWLLLFAMAMLTCQVTQGGIRKLVKASQPTPSKSEIELSKPSASAVDMVECLRHNHGHFWRRKTRILLVIGEPAEIDAIAPNLAKQLWLEGENTVLLWGGSPQAELDTSRLNFGHGRPLDGVVWAVTRQQGVDSKAMRVGLQHLRELARKVRWQLPVHLWQVCESAWPQDARPTQPVGCLLDRRATPSMLEDSLQALVEPLRRQGWAQMQGDMLHDFLVRLSGSLQTEGIARWCKVLAPWWDGFARGVPLRGLWFSLPVRRLGDDTEHFWLADPAWRGVQGDRTSSQRLGWSSPRWAFAVFMALAVVWGAGMSLSFVSNRAQILQVQSLLTTLQQASQQSSSHDNEQLLALHELVRELARLDDRVVHGAPWYQRFGLNRNDTLREVLWPHYVAANNRLIRDPAAARLREQLSALVQLAPDNPARAERARDAYDQLKAYLMMARPEKAEAGLLAKTLGSVEPIRGGLSTGLWQSLAPNLWQFYAQQLPAHPEWRIEVDPRLVAQVRQVLLGQLGQRNAEANLYQQVLEEAAQHYPALGLQQMVGDTEAAGLFSSSASVAGVFTRQAWEGQVRRAIDEIAQARREEIDWVLSDKPGEVDSRLSAEELKQRLTERYFQDYASAWLVFLNSLRTRQPASLSEVIDQLTLMSDVRQSPLIALINTLAYQGQAGQRTQALADSLMKSAQKLIGPNTVPVIDQLSDLPSGPLDITFGPLLALVGKGPEANGGSADLSLQTFLTRVTRMRLKLQQVSSAADPLDMTQALAQTVFQGRGIDLTDTQSYGRLMAASLGAQWARVGETLFVQPLEQAWQQVLQPSAAGLNSQWQRSIVDHWNAAFAGRYPFAATTSDASLPMLGQMIRADSGRIERFLHSQLSGVLRKEGNRWVADPRHGQGLRLNPRFLAAVNQLNELADVLYTDGGLGLSFELRGKPLPNVVQSTFTLNGEKHHYFNQRERWQRFNWPGRSDYPGVRLTWTGLVGEEQLFGDYAGTWGLIRLLEIARITPLDDSDSHFRMVIDAGDGANLTWHLRTELDAGPLALLRLRGFTLPRQIFLGADQASGAYAHNEVVE